MRTRIVLFLLSSVIVFGCVKPSSQKGNTMGTGNTCTDANPCVTVHEVVLDGECPGTLRLGSRDVVKFSNQTGQKVLVFGLDNKAANAPDSGRAAPRLSGKKHIPLWPDDPLGYVQVNKNPSSDSLTFEYSVKYTGPGGQLCGAPPDSVVMRRMSLAIPPTMIVGPDTL